MGYDGKLLTAACDQQPATSSTAWLHLLHPERWKRKLKQPSGSVSGTSKGEGKKRPTKHTQHIIIIALYALLLTAQKKHILGKKTMNNYFWSAKHKCVKHMSIKYIHTTVHFYSVLYLQTRAYTS